MTEIKICGIKYDEDIGIINELKPDYAGMVLFFEKLVSILERRLRNSER